MPPLALAQAVVTAAEAEYDGEGDASVSRRGEPQELDWDGRRRYHNVWDTLSAPKRTSNVRSVRARLQREFSNVGPPAGGDGASGRRASGAGRRPSNMEAHSGAGRRPSNMEAHNGARRPANLPTKI